MSTTYELIIALFSPAYSYFFPLTSKYLGETQAEGVRQQGTEEDIWI
jgi:hypothetical protein